jgi:hypothetical protein
MRDAIYPQNHPQNRGKTTPKTDPQNQGKTRVKPGKEITPHTPWSLRPSPVARSRTSLGLCGNSGLRFLPRRPAGKQSVLDQPLAEFLASALQDWLINLNTPITNTHFEHKSPNPLARLSPSARSDRCAFHSFPHSATWPTWRDANRAGPSIQTRWMAASPKPVRSRPTRRPSRPDICPHRMVAGTKCRGSIHPPTSTKEFITCP